MPTNDSLEALRAELARQDAELAAATAAVAELPPGAVAHVPADWLDELESLCAPPPRTTFEPHMFGQRA
jgi:hypothetical protein